MITTSRCSSLAITSASREAPQHSKPRSVPFVANDHRSSVSPPSRLPSFEFEHPSPAGGGKVRVRPKEPTDHFVCVSAGGFGSRCMDLPVRISG